MNEISNLKCQISKRGFTLIEMLVVVSIIGLLASFMYARFSTSEKIARDTKRKSDIGQYRIALENFAVVKNGLYPSSGASTVVRADEVCAAALTSYTSACPKDSLDNPADPATRRYIYRGTTGVLGQPTSTKYALYVHAGLEAEPTKTWVVCWDGKSGTVDNSMSAVDTFCPI